MNNPTHTTTTIDEATLRMVLGEIARGGHVGTTVARIAAALRQQGMDPITARNACQQLIARGDAEYSPHAVPGEGMTIHVRLPERADAASA